MSIHILIECPELIATVRLGIIETLKPLVEDGRCELRYRPTININRKDIVWADIVVGVRSCDALSLAILSEAKKADRLIIYYLDDDLLNIPRESIGWMFFSNQEIKGNLTKCIGLSDYLWGVNKNIRDKYLHYTSGKWMENKLPFLSTSFLPKEKDNTKIRVLYAGSEDHTPLVKELLSPVIYKLAKEYQEKVEFVFIGANPGIDGLQNVKYLPFINPYEAYRKYMEENQFQIGLAPGRINSFYACKYYNKFIEYASIGAVGVYSDAQPYTQIVKQEINGLLCNNTHESWYHGIKRLIDNPELLYQCKINVINQLRTDFDPNNIVNNLLKQCPELISYKAKKINEYYIHLPGSLYHYFNRAKIIWQENGFTGIPIIYYKAKKKMKDKMGKS